MLYEVITKRHNMSSMRRQVKCSIHEPQFYGIDPGFFLPCSRIEGKGVCHEVERTDLGSNSAGHRNLWPGGRRGEMEGGAS